MTTEQAERLMAYHDGELNAEDEAEVRELIERDAEAQQFLEALRQADRLAAAELGPMLDVPVPQQLTDTVRGTSGRGGQVVTLPTRQRANWSWAVAAGLTLMVALGTRQLLMGPGGDGPTSYDRLVQNALESTPSGEIAVSADGEWQLTPVSSVLTAEGRYCRDYAAEGPAGQLVGLACRSPAGRWQRAIEQRDQAEQSGNAFLPAEGETDAALDDLLQREGAVHLGYAAEQRAIRSGWALSAGEGPDQ
jgi:hypothetical protein